MTRQLVAAAGSAYLGPGGYSAGREIELARRLQRGEPDAVLELFDDIAPWAYGYALRCTRSKKQAITAIRQAFVHVCENPEVFADQRLPARSRIFLEIHHYVVLGLSERRPPRWSRRTQPENTL